MAHVLVALREGYRCVRCRWKYSDYPASYRGATGRIPDSDPGRRSSSRDGVEFGDRRHPRNAAQVGICRCSSYRTPPGSNHRRCYRPDRCHDRRRYRMSPGVYTERAFEDRVEYELFQRGWEPASGLFSAELGIHTGALWEFIGRTQIKRWNKLIELYGGDPDVAQRQFALRVASEIDSRGVLDVLRQGVKDRGVQIDLAYFRPGHTLGRRCAGRLQRQRADGRAAAPLQLPGPQPVGGHGVFRQRAARRHRRAEEPEHRAERRPRHRPVPAAATRTICSSPSAPSCTSPSIRTGPSSPRG